MLEQKNFKIWTIENKEEENFLRQKTEEFDFKKFKSNEITKLINHMKKMMEKANGIGLSANQIGLPYKVFVAKMPNIPKNNLANKFYAIFNPKIEKVEGKKIDLEEGCLSVPDMFGKTPRYPKITISGFNRYGKPIKIKAWGLLAHIFQHEIDHLNGKLFIDSAKELKNIKDIENNTKNE
jgi:peptide deformylase